MAGVIYRDSFCTRQRWHGKNNHRPIPVATKILQPYVRGIHCTGTETPSAPSWFCPESLFTRRKQRTSLKILRLFLHHLSMRHSTTWTASPVLYCSVPTMYLVDTACRTHVNTTRVTREGYQMVSRFLWNYLLQMLSERVPDEIISQYCEIKCCFEVRLYSKRHISPLLSMCPITTEEEVLDQMSPPLLAWWSTSISI
jgi:hypothetical protein